MVEGDRLYAALIACAEGAGSEPTVAVVSDRRLSVAALVALLQTGPRDDVVAVVSGHPGVTGVLSRHRPAVIVAEGTLATLPAVDYRSWGGRLLLVLDPEDDSRAFGQAVRLGADGYLSRAATAEALGHAIDALGHGVHYVDPLLDAHLRWAEDELERAAARPRLSRREQRIVVAIAEGRSTKEIARECDVTAKTVCNHVSNIYTKLAVRNRGQLVLYAAQAGLL